MLIIINTQPSFQESKLFLFLYVSSSFSGRILTRTSNLTRVKKAVHGIPELKTTRFLKLRVLIHIIMINNFSSRNWRKVKYQQDHRMSFEVLQSDLEAMVETLSGERLYHISISSGNVKPFKDSCS